MAALDTNVLVRYLVQDDARQGLQAKALVRAALTRGESLLVPITVLHPHRPGACGRAGAPLDIRQSGCKG